MPGIKANLERIYKTYNRRLYVDPDPLLFLYDYPDVKDREIAAFIAACFAYGRVKMIMQTVDSILQHMKPGPLEYLCSCTRPDLEKTFAGFCYRFANQENLVSLLWGIRQVIDQFGSLHNCFGKGLSNKDETVLPGLQFLSDSICRGGNIGHLLADPQKGSACKRSHLFLRWMVRKDDVDPGGWEDVGTNRLIVPLDTHMHRAGMILGFTKKKSTGIRTALEITEGFKKINEHDPVKYDFCLTRFGIRKELDMKGLKKELFN